MNFPKCLYQSKHFLACKYGIPLHLSIYAEKNVKRKKKEKDHNQQQTRIPPPQTVYRQWHKQSKNAKKKSHTPQKNSKILKNFQILKKKTVCIHVRPTPGAPKPKGIETSS